MSACHSCALKCYDTFNTHAQHMHVVATVATVIPSAVKQSVIGQPMRQMSAEIAESKDNMKQVEGRFTNLLLRTNTRLTWKSQQTGSDG